MAKLRNSFWMDSPATDVRRERKSRAQFGEMVSRWFSAMKPFRQLKISRSMVTRLKRTSVVRVAPDVINEDSSFDATAKASSKKAIDNSFTRITAERVASSSALFDVSSAKSLRAKMPRSAPSRLKKLTTTSFRTRELTVSGDSDEASVPLARLASRFQSRVKAQPKWPPISWSAIKKRLFCGPVLVAVLTASVGVVSVKVVQAWLQQYPIRRVVFRSDFEHLNAEMIQPELNGLLQTSLLELNLSEVRERLLAVPWVEQVDVRRAWPDTLEIALREKRVVARWGDKGLVSDRGEVFFAPMNATLEVLLVHLPVLKGSESDVAETLVYYEQMSEILSAINMRITTLTRGSRDWKIELNDTVMVMVGHEGVFDKLIRFRQVYEQLGEQKAYVKSADLRYHHGVAIKWLSRDGSETEERRNDQS